VRSWNFRNGESFNRRIDDTELKRFRVILVEVELIFRRKTALVFALGEGDCVTDSLWF
jgi:hypothetical protein